ncbi:MAG: hypothetical protein LBI43_02005 [Streptococcaceae bacterium]|jgi:hypothetical protein|nr:hypothetical protein [Streptococcaceae bacterium]
MKIHPRLQLVMRIVIWIVALGLFAAGAVTGWGFIQDHRAPKAEVTATIVHDPGKDADDLALSYSFGGRAFIERPIGKLLDNYGKRGENLQVWVEKDSPRRVFITKTPKGELLHSLILLGWSLILFCIVWSERRLLLILENLGTKEN